MTVWLTKHEHWEKSMKMRASLDFYFGFTYSKTAISFNILLVLQILCLRNICIFQVSNYICIHIQSMQFPFITYGIWHYDITTVCRQNANIETIYVRASELRHFLHFHIKKTLLFLSIFCWYFRNFVGTNDIYCRLTCTDRFQMYRQNSEKHYWGGGGEIAPPPLATPVDDIMLNLYISFFLARDLWRGNGLHELLDMSWHTVS